VKEGGKIPASLVCFVLANAFVPFLINLTAGRIGLSTNQIGIIVTIHEAACAAGSFLILWIRCTTLPWTIALAASLFFVALADLGYGVTSYIVRVPPPRGLVPLYHEIPYVMFAVLSAFSAGLRAIQGLKKAPKVAIGVFMFVGSAILFICSYEMILKAFFSALPRRPLALYLTATLYAIGQSIFGASLLVASVRAMGYREFLIWFAFLVMIASDFVLRYQDIGGSISSLSFFEYGWHFSLASIFSLLVLKGAAVKSLSQRASLEFSEPSPLDSVRVISVSLALVSLVIYILASWFMTSFLSVATPSSLGSTLLLFSVIWGLSNLAGIFLSKIILARSLSLSAKINEIHDLQGIMGLTNGPTEFEPIVDSLKLMQKQLGKTLIENSQLKADAAVGEMMTQVAHDIRSPLAALEMIAQSSPEIPERKRILVRSAVGRITDIANELLENGKDLRTKTDLPAPAEELQGREEIVLLSSLLDSILTEKRMQFRARIGLEIESDLSAVNYGLFAKIGAANLRRVLSNLINNAVEAIDGPGRISLRVSRASDTEVQITIQDNGKGMSDEILRHLGERNFSHGKKNGFGRGFSHAKEVLSSIGGRIEVQSKEGLGTSIILHLKKQSPPQWFVQRLRIKGQRIIIVDDDPTIHQVWDARFAEHAGDTQNIELFHFLRPQELQVWVNEMLILPSDLVLMDYEFTDSEVNGIEVILGLNIRQQSILVTSRFGDSEIIEQAASYGLRIVPKGLAGFVPIIFKSSFRPRAVLLDDDVILRETWALRALEAGVELTVFQSERELLAALSWISKNTAFFIDFELGGRNNGAEVAKALFGLGYQNITLTTGHSSLSVDEVPWVKGITGKAAPFLAQSLIS